MADNFRFIFKEPDHNHARLNQCEPMKTQPKSLGSCMLLPSILLVAVSACKDIPQNHQLLADSVIVEIKDFQSKNQRLPADLKEVGRSSDESGPIYYQKLDSLNFELWYGLSLGESKTYDSRTGKWKEGE